MLFTAPSGQTGLASESVHVDFNAYLVCVSVTSPPEKQSSGMGKPQALSSLQDRHCETERQLKDIKRVIEGLRDGLRNASQVLWRDASAPLGPQQKPLAGSSSIWSTRATSIEIGNTRR